MPGRGELELLAQILLAALDEHELAGEQALGGAALRAPVVLGHGPSLRPRRWSLKADSRSADKARRMTAGAVEPDVEIVAPHTDRLLARLDLIAAAEEQAATAEEQA